MAIQVRYVGEVAILSGIGHLMNDPRHFDAGTDLGDLLDEGCRRFVLELVGVRETGASLLGLLMTLTRKIRQAKGEVVLAQASGSMLRYLEEMQMEEFWELFDKADEAARWFDRGADPEEANDRRPRLPREGGRRDGRRRAGR